MNATARLWLARSRSAVPHRLARCMGMVETGAAELIIDPPRRVAKIVLHADAVDVQVVDPVHGLIRQAAEADLEQLEIDLSKVSFADTAVVRLALLAREHVEPKGGQVVIKAPDAVLRLFHLTRTSDLFALVAA